MLVWTLIEFLILSFVLRVISLALLKGVGQELDYVGSFTDFSSPHMLWAKFF